MIENSNEYNLNFFLLFQGSDISNLIGQYMQVINRHKKRPNDKMSLQRYHWQWLVNYLTCTELCKNETTLCILWYIYVLYQFSANVQALW